MKLLPYTLCLTFSLALSVQAQSLDIGQDGNLEMQTPDRAVTNSTDGSKTSSSRQGDISTRGRGDGAIEIVGPNRGFGTDNRVDSSQTSYTNASLVGNDFSSKRLSGVNFMNADLSSANLSNADLSNAVLTNADLKNADLRNANLTGAEITNADFTNAKLAGATWVNGKVCGQGSVSTCY